VHIQVAEEIVYFADHSFDPDMGRFFYGRWSPSLTTLVFITLKIKRVNSLKGLGRLSSHHALWLSPCGW
jgi:hypothetical protein